MKPQLLLLHGALGSHKTLLPLSKALASTFDCHLFDFNGHGEKGEISSFTMSSLSDQLIAFIEKNIEGSFAVFGYSMGGYVALCAALKKPSLPMEHLITLGTKFNWTRESAAKETEKLNWEFFVNEHPKYADYLRSLHGDKAPQLIQSTARMMKELGENADLNTENLSAISVKTTILRGEKDRMVTEEESVWAATHLVNGVYQQLPSTPHPIEKVDTSLLADEIRKV